MNNLRLEPLSESNFEAFASIINCEDAGCYCSFWHQKWSSMEEWDKRKAEAPDKNKACMLEKVRSRFHVGVLVYRESEIVAWVSEASIFQELVAYSKQQGWAAIEGYPFDRETIDRLGDKVTWPGFPEDFVEAGFKRVGDHWLNSKEYARSIYPFLKTTAPLTT